MSFPGMARAALDDDLARFYACDRFVEDEIDLALQKADDIERRCLVHRRVLRLISQVILGVEAAVWTEFIETERYLEFMTFPPLLALAEVAWRPKGPRDEAEFAARLEPHLEALRARGINARRGEWDAYEFIRN